MILCVSALWPFLCVCLGNGIVAVTSRFDPRVCNHKFISTPLNV